jgi:4-hydroxy-2-oxoheptanedioate aldolase
MVETAEAMRNLDAIAATPGLDGIYVGPADLTFSLHQGRLPPGFDREEPEIIEVLQTVVAACNAAGKRAHSIVAPRNTLRVRSDGAST